MVKIYRTIIFPVVLYGCETWSLTLREERRLRVFENMVLRRIFGPKRDEVTEEWSKLRIEELNDLYSLPNIVFSNKIENNEMGGACSAYGGRREACRGFWWGNRRERDHFGDPGADGKEILRWMVRMWDVRAWTGSSWLRIGTGDGHL